MAPGTPHLSDHVCHTTHTATHKPATRGEPAAPLSPPVNESPPENTATGGCSLPSGVNGLSSNMASGSVVGSRDSRPGDRDAARSDASSPADLSASIRDPY